MSPLERRTRKTRGRLRWTAALAAAGLALTGCGAGQHAQTSGMKPAISGIDATTEQLALRDIAVDFGESGNFEEGGNAALRVWVSNKGETAVVLESVTSPTAEAVTLVTEESGTDEPTAEETPADETEESPAEEETSEATAEEAPEAEETAASPVGEREFAVEIAPGAYARLSPKTGTYLQLEGLTERVNLGSRVEVVFTFSNGDVVTMRLPVAVPEGFETRSFFEGSDTGGH